MTNLRINFTARTDEACLVDMLGGGIITSLTEHCPIMAQKIIGVGDYNSSFRILVLPPAFKSKLPMEAEVGLDFFSDPSM